LERCINQKREQTEVHKPEERTSFGMGLPGALRVRLTGNLAPMKKTAAKFGRTERFNCKLIFPLANKQGKQMKDETAEVQSLREAKAVRKELAFRERPRYKQCLKVINVKIESRSCGDGCSPGDTPTINQIETLEKSRVKTAVT
jgi:hypothetical protein